MILSKRTLLFCLTVFYFSCSKESTDIELEEEKETRQLSKSDSKNPNPFNGVMSAITALPYNEISTKVYTIKLGKWDIPNNKTNPEKTTNNLQKAIDWAVKEGYGIIKLPAGHYLIGKYSNAIYQAGITLSSNIAFLLDKNAIIEMAPNNKWNYCAIAIREKSHVIISGGLILGDRDNHTYTPRKSDGSTSHDEGHLICVENESEYITIQNTTLAKANGDAILLVGQKGEGSSVKHITIKRNQMTDNRRQGISIVGGEDVLIQDNEIHHTNGIAPQFGIDIESLTYNSENITIKNNYFHHNKGGDIVNTDGKNVVIENNILLQGENNEYIDAPLVYRKKADLTIKNNRITMRTQSVNGWNGIIMYSNDTPKTNPATTYIYNNTLNNCGMYMYKGADLVVKDNHMNNGHLVFKEMKNLTLNNNKVEHDDKCWAYRFKEVSGKATGNTYNNQVFEIPLSNEPWNGCWIN